MCTVAGARMHAAARPPPRNHPTEPPRIDARFRGDAGFSSFTAVPLTSRPPGRTSVRIAVSGKLLPSRTTSAPRCGGYAGAGPSTPGDLVSGTHDNSPAPLLGIDEVAPWVL